MELGNLVRVCDSKIADSRVDDYSKTAKELSSNFYAKLLAKIALLLRNDKNFLSTVTTSESRILGNDVTVVRYPKDNSVKVAINGKEVYSGKAGENTAVDSVLSVVRAELDGSIKINRPEGRSISKDRIELSSKNLDKLGLKYPQSIYKQMSRDNEGNKVKSVKRNFKSQSYLSERDYNYLVNNGQIEPSDYYKEDDIYIRNKVPYFQIKGDYGNLINNFDEALAREPGFDEFYEDNYLKRQALISYKGEEYSLNKGYLKKD